MAIMETLQALDMLPDQLDSFRSKMQESLNQFRDSYRADLQASFKQIFELVQQHYNLELANNETVVESPFTAADYGITLDFHSEGSKSVASRYTAEVPTVHVVEQFHDETQSLQQEILGMFPTGNDISTELSKTSDCGKIVECGKAGQTMKPYVARDLVESFPVPKKSSYAEHVSGMELKFSANIEVCNECNAARNENNPQLIAKEIFVKCGKHGFIEAMGDTPKVFEEMRPRVKMKKNLAAIITVQFKHRARIKFRRNRYYIDGTHEDHKQREGMCNNKRSDSVLKEPREGVLLQQLSTQGKVSTAILGSSNDLLHALFTTQLLDVIIASPSLSPKSCLGVNRAVEFLIAKGKPNMVEEWAVVFELVGDRNMNFVVDCTSKLTVIPPSDLPQLDEQSDTWNYWESFWLFGRTLVSIDVKILNLDKWISVFMSCAPADTPPPLKDENLVLLSEVQRIKVLSDCEFGVKVYVYVIVGYNGYNASSWRGALLVVELVTHLMNVNVTPDVKVDLFHLLPTASEGIKHICVNGWDLSSHFSVGPSVAKGYHDMSKKGTMEDIPCLISSFQDLIQLVKVCCWFVGSMVIVSVQDSRPRVKMRPTLSTLNPAFASIKSEVLGCFGAVFYDSRLEQFIIEDGDGGNTCVHIIVSIGNDKLALAACVEDERLGFLEKDSIVFFEVQGITKLGDGKPWMSGMSKGAVGGNEANNFDAYLQLAIKVLAVICRVPGIDTSQGMVSKKYYMKWTRGQHMVRLTDVDVGEQELQKIHCACDLSLEAKLATFIQIVGVEYTAKKSRKKVVKFVILYHEGVVELWDLHGHFVFTKDLLQNQKAEPLEEKDVVIKFLDGDFGVLEMSKSMTFRKLKRTKCKVLSHFAICVMAMFNLIAAVPGVIADKSMLQQFLQILEDKDLVDREELSGPRSRCIKSSPA